MSIALDMYTQQNNSFHPNYETNQARILESNGPEVLKSMIEYIQVKPVRRVFYGYG
jgi:hypothetical protein